MFLIVLAFLRKKHLVIRVCRLFIFYIRVFKHGANIDYWGLIHFVFNSRDLLKVVLSSVVPNAFKFGSFHIDFIAPNALEFDLWKLGLALRKSNVHWILIKWFHCFGLTEWRLEFRFYLIFQGWHRPILFIEILLRTDIIR